MRGLGLLAFVLWQAGSANERPAAQREYMRYERSFARASGEGQVCAVLDARVFPHAAPALADLRVFPLGAGVREVPYVITMSQTATEETQAVRVLNLGAVGNVGSGTFAFDMEMPGRAYTDVVLAVDPEVRDFIATARVAGMNTLGGGGKATAVGVFTLFDLSSQHLGRHTTLPLPESTFRFLHVVLSVSAAPGSAGAARGRFVPGMVLGAAVPPSRQGQVLYTTVAETTSVTHSGRESEAVLAVPARVPAERVSFVLSPGFKGNFSRAVRISALPVRGQEAGARGNSEEPDAPPEEVSGEIVRVHTNEAGREIRTEELGVPAILGANLQGAARVKVTIENGDDQTLPIAAVRLEMRQRRLCFDAAGAVAGAALFYGDPALAAPVYDYQRLFRPAENASVVLLGAEVLNAGFRERVSAAKPFTERHPEVLWVALIAVVCALGTVALRSARSVHGP